MRYVDEFRNPEAARSLAQRIAQVARGAPPMRLMEVCGGHTAAIYRFGIPQLLPSTVELLSGPGCPVCVTPTTYIDRAIELCDEPDIVLATFGDLYRVPGSAASLEDVAASGADVRVVYSPRDALSIALGSPEREVVFLAVGFETTAPGVAATILEAESGAAANFRVLSGHKTMPPALRALVDASEVAIDGFLLPGHVSTVIGQGAYEPLVQQHGIACCIAGFEPTDVLLAVLSLVQQVAAGRPSMQNRYGRVVRPDGNPRALAAMGKVFEPVESQWRGLGLIPGSGLDLREQFHRYRVAPPDPAQPSHESDRCRCPQVLRGVARPEQCPLFATVCTPDSPVGPCMVSSEGACAARYKYGTAPGPVA
jgi:hydrogenase expression/formation protein HypD